LSITFLLAFEWDRKALKSLTLRDLKIKIRKLGKKKQRRDGGKVESPTLAKNQTASEGTQIVGADRGWPARLGQKPVFFGTQGVYWGRNALVISHHQGGNGHGSLSVDGRFGMSNGLHTTSPRQFLGNR
jgi:hypothetical protein